MIAEGKIKKIVESTSMAAASENSGEIETRARHACSTGRYLKIFSLLRDNGGPSITRYKKAGATS